MAQSLSEKSKRTSEVLLEVDPCGNHGGSNIFSCRCGWGWTSRRSIRYLGEYNTRIRFSTLLVMSGCIVLSGVSYKGIELVAPGLHCCLHGYALLLQLKPE
jgi:hypothetical protein